MNLSSGVISSQYPEQLLLQTYYPRNLRIFQCSDHFWNQSHIPNINYNAYALGCLRVISTWFLQILIASLDYSILIAQNDTRYTASGLRKYNLGGELNMEGDVCQKITHQRGLGNNSSEHLEEYINTVS